MFRRTLVLFAVVSLSAVCHSQLIVNQNLGVVDSGPINISGTTAGAGNEASHYGLLTDPANTWDEEFVYQFTITSNATYELTSNAITGDPDFFLLDSLSVENDGFVDFASGGLHYDFLDDTPPQTGDPVELTAGTYYLSIDTFQEGSVSTWDATINLTGLPPTSCFSAMGLNDGFYDRDNENNADVNPYGVQEFTVDMSGDYTINMSWDDFDGYLYLFDSPFAGDDSTAIAFDDDFNGTDDSQIDDVFLTAGQSYFLVGTTFDPMPGVTDLTSLKTTIDGPGIATEVVGVVNGDFDNNGVYECDDINSLAAEILAETNSAEFDLTGDGNVNADDRNAWLAEAASANGLASPYKPGDANLDGVVDVSDFNLWNLNKFSATSDWCHGDFNGDGSVDVSDFNLWNLNKFSFSDAAAVPEPSAIGLLLIGIGCLIRRKKIHRS